MELLKLINPSELVVQMASFLVLLILLRVFAWKRILAILEERRRRIAGEFEAIERAQAEVARMKADYDKRLEEIEGAARERINAAIDDGRKSADEIRKLAHAQAQDIITDARKSIAYELKKAQDEVRDRIVDLVIGATEAVISEKLTEDNDRKIAEEFIENIGKEE
ncbi:MAG: F0F1 ATP synthase subunit B [Candidatus Omnitrophica bacterium]|nr:F0F1 ATP synthase subunit B [Candidatus Omnitrophota bacterium]